MLLRGPAGSGVGLGPWMQHQRSLVALTRAASGEPGRTGFRGEAGSGQERTQQPRKSCAVTGSETRGVAPGGCFTRSQHTRPSASLTPGPAARAGEPDPCIPTKRLCRPLPPPPRPRHHRHQPRERPPESPTSSQVVAHPRARRSLFRLSYPCPLGRRPLSPLFPGLRRQ